MIIGILNTSISDCGKHGFYNSQEIGLAKALGKHFEKVRIFKLVSGGKKEEQEKIKENENVDITRIHAYGLGVNGIIDLKKLDASLDCLIYFSDTQLSVPKVYGWCRKNNIKFYPYIGVIESHSTNKINRLIINCLFKRNLKIYRKVSCLVKTPMVEMQLEKRGVRKIEVTPVGLDTTLLKFDYKKYSEIELKNKHQYSAQDKIILFIGRLTEEKQPLRMLDIFAKIKKKDTNYKLLMVGSGKLKGELERSIGVLELKKEVKLVEKTLNSEIWELYRIADCFVNLNQQEIFGMAILEAMFYECKVVAWKAPGPNYIIENNEDGYIVENNEEIIVAIEKDKEMGIKAHKKTVDFFTWSSITKNCKYLEVGQSKA